MKLKLLLVCLMGASFSLKAQICIDCNTSSAHNATYGLEACFPFDGNANDATGNNTNIEVRNAKLAFGHDGKQNSAYNFDGQDYIFLNDLYDYNQRSLSIWFKLEKLTGSYQNIYVSDDPSLSNGLTAFAIRNTVAPELQYVVGGSAYYNLSISLGQWYHAVIVVDDANVKYYLNGSLVQTGTNDKFNSVSGKGSAVIGGSRDTSTYWFHGSVDNFRIYNGVLDSAAIDSLYLMNCCPDCSTSCIDCDTTLNSNAGLQACFTFDGNANDGSGKGNGSSVNGPALVKSRFGETSHAYVFDGTNDYITIDNMFDYDKRTYSVWFKANSATGIANDIIVSDGPNLVNGLTAIAVRNNGGQPEVAYSTGSNAQHFIPIQLYRWYHAVTVVDGANVTYYLDNVAYTGLTNDDFKSVNGVNKTVIGSARDLTTYWFDGTIDDIKVFDQALTSADVGKLYEDFCDTSSGTGIQTSNLAQLQVYPNPGNGQVNMKWPNELQDAQLQVFNAQGQLILTSRVNGQGTTINLSKQSRGVYFITVSDEGGHQYRTRYIKQE